MTCARFGLSLVGVAAVLAATLAGATIWLVLTDPTTVVDAVSEDDITPLVRDLAAVLYEALQSLLRYL
jgi:ABC-type cobalamin/Fe3+-siderophores transport system ATPase subunit